jgi:macrocin-O-methyltransferase TylF-like protien
MVLFKDAAASGVQAVAMLRCDGDSFESTYGVLADLYDQVIDNKSMFWQKPREVSEHLSRRSGSSAV